MAKKVVVKNYECVADYVADVSRNVPREQLKANSSHDTGRRDFFWTERYEDAQALAISGWADGTARVASQRDRFAAFISAAKAIKAKSFGWDVEGQFVDVGRFLSGEPECFGTEFDNGESISGRVCSIRLNACVSGAISADTICARGVTVLVAVDLLEACGIRCEVTVSAATQTSALQLDSNVVVKKAGDAVDLDKLSFCIAHPSFFRRFGFRFCEIYGHDPSNCYPCPLSDYGQQGVVEIDEILSGASLSPAQLQANVLKIAKSCGLDFNDEQIAELAAAGAA